MPATAIQPAREDDHGAFFIDNAQIFLIDEAHYKNIRNDILKNGSIWPNFDLFEELRKKYKTAFGYIVSGDLYDCNFDGDGIFRIDFSLMREGLPTSVKSDHPDPKERLRRIISAMNTLVCAKCRSSELRSHPVLGSSPCGRGKDKKKWAVAMAQYAISIGWTATDEKGCYEI